MNVVLMGSTLTRAAFVYRKTDFFFFPLSMRKFFFGLLAGLSAGLLFAPESGKKLRERLKNSDAMLSDFGKAFLEAGKGAGDEVQRILEAEELQKLLKNGKKTLSDFAEVIDKKSRVLSEKAQKELESVVESALKKTESVKKGAKRVARAAVKTAEKKVATVKKKVKKAMQE